MVLGRDPALRRALGWLDSARRSLLPAGAILCVGCRSARQNIGYRAVLLILVLPGLNALAHRAGHGALLFRVTALILVLVLWGSTLSRKLPVWLLGLAWWWITLVLSVILVAGLGVAVAGRLGWENRFWPGRIA